MEPKKAITIFIPFKSETSVLCVYRCSTNNGNQQRSQEGR